MAASDENVRNAIFSIDVSKVTSSLPVRKGTACAVITEDSPDRPLLVTSRNVIEHGGTLTHAVVRAKRFCSKISHRDDEHLINCTFDPSYTEQSRFCYIPHQVLQQPLKYALKLVSVSKLREAGERLRKSTCLSFTFLGTSFTTLKWEFDEGEQVHVLTKIEPQGELVESAHRGSPVVSMEDDDRAVIGVVDCTCDGDLCLTFITETFLEDIKVATGATCPDARDVTNSPFIPPESRPAVQSTEEEQVASGATDSKDVTDSPLIPLESIPVVQNPEETQGNRPGVSSSPTDLSRSLSHMGIQETLDPSGKDKMTLEKKFEEDKCLWDQEVPSLEKFQNLLTTVLKINLDPKREFGGDYRSLAGVFGKNMKGIWYLERASSPIEELLKEYRPTLSRLYNLLLREEVGREDVAKEIAAWVEKTGCSCSKCGLISLR